MGRGESILTEFFKQPLSYFAANVIINIDAAVEGACVDYGSTDKTVGVAVTLGKNDPLDRLYLKEVYLVGNDRLIVVEFIVYSIFVRFCNFSFIPFSVCSEVISLVILNSGYRYVIRFDGLRIFAKEDEAVFELVERSFDGGSLSFAANVAYSVCL